MARTGKIVNKGELAEIFGVTDRSITLWMRNGLPPLTETKRGQASSFNTKDAIAWKINAEIQKILPEGARVTAFDRNAEDARLKRFQADKAEVEAQIARREVIKVEDVQDILSEVAVIYGTQVDALGGRLANDLSSITDPAEIRAKIFEESRRIRNETADALQEFASGFSSEVGDAGKGTESEDG